MVKGDNRGTTSTIIRNEIPGGMFSGCNIHSLSNKHEHASKHRGVKRFKSIKLFLHLLENSLTQAIKDHFCGEQDSKFSGVAFFIYSGFEPIERKVVNLR